MLVCDNINTDWKMNLLVGDRPARNNPGVGVIPIGAIFLGFTNPLIEVQWVQVLG